MQWRAVARRATRVVKSVHHWRFPMRRVVSVLTVAVAAVALGTMAFAQAPATKAPTAKPAVEKTTHLSVKGEAKYDEATKTLAVGDKTFTLAPHAKVMMGSKTVPITEATGKHVMVTYTVENGQDVALKVTITSTTEKKAPAPAPAKK
jgi:hypothetical protein